MILILPKNKINHEYNHIYQNTLGSDFINFTFLSMGKTFLHNLL